MRCDSPFPLRRTRPPAAIREMPPQFLPASFFSVMSANEIIGPSNMAIWNSTCRERPGCGRHDDARIQKMAECFLESYLKKKA